MGMSDTYIDRRRISKIAAGFLAVGAATILGGLTHAFAQGKPAPKKTDEQLQKEAKDAMDRFWDKVDERDRKHKRDQRDKETERKNKEREKKPHDSAADKQISSS